MLRRALLLFALTTAACSTSNGDGVEPDVSASTAAVGTTTATSGAGEGGMGQGATSSADTTSSGGEGGVAGHPEQNVVTNHAWAYFQGAHDSLDQQPPGDGWPAPAPRAMVGCAVDAPELGARVVYVERWSPDSPEVLDRQFLLSLVADAPVGIGSFATARIFRPVDPSAWEGSCEVGVTMPMLGEVAGSDACQLELSTELGDVSISADEIPATCFSGDLDATTVVSSGMHLTSQRITWVDLLSDSEGGTTYDPPSEGDQDAYEMARRSDMPPVPAPP